MKSGAAKECVCTINKGEQVEIFKERTEMSECCITSVPQRKSRVMLKVREISFEAVCAVNTTHESTSKYFSYLNGLSQ